MIVAWSGDCHDNPLEPTATRTTFGVKKTIENISDLFGVVLENATTESPKNKSFATVVSKSLENPLHPLLHDVPNTFVRLAKTVLACEVIPYVFRIHRGTGKDGHLIRFNLLKVLIPKHGNVFAVDHPVAVESGGVVLIGFIVSVGRRKTLVKGRAVTKTLLLCIATFEKTTSRMLGGGKVKNSNFLRTFTIKSFCCSEGSFLCQLKIRSHDRGGRVKVKVGEISTGGS